MKTFWMTPEELEELADSVPKFPTFCAKYASHPSMIEFRKHKAISMIYTSNKLEDTLPKSASEHDTYQLLYGLVATGCKSDPGLAENNAGKTWCADGVTANGSASKDQMFHHVEAYRYLCETKVDGKFRYEQNLTVDVLLTAHALLMNKAVGPNGETISSGCFRTHSVHAGPYVYVQHEWIAPAVDKILAAYNLDRKTSSFISSNPSNAIKLAVDLFYDLITVHPFADGNGRFCRLMATFALFAAGTPFAISLASGHKRSRRHYMTSILKARGLNNDKKYLYTLFASSIQAGWCNFMTNVNYEEA